MKIMILAGLAVMFSVGEMRAEPISACTLIVDGKQYITGPCEFFPLGGGSFKVLREPWFAYVNLHPDQLDLADGSWNENPLSNHAESQLGLLVHHQECWMNERAIVCAKK
jgi:hypothetical protein